MKDSLSIPVPYLGQSWFNRTCTQQRKFHSHEELEVNLVLRGTGTYFLDSQRHPIQAGTILWLFPDQEHVLVDGPDEVCMWVWVFKKQMLKDFHREDARVLQAGNPPGVYCRQLSPKDVLDLDRLSKRISQQHEDPDLFNAGLRYILLSFWQAFMEASSNIGGQAIHPAVEKAVRLIEENPARDSLPEIAEKTGLSPGRLSRLFKAQTGVPMTMFRNRLRIEQAIRLHHKGLELSRAALQAGFGSYPQFYRVFKSLMGSNPQQWFKHGA